MDSGMAKVGVKMLLLDRLVVLRSEVVGGLAGGKGVVKLEASFQIVLRERLDSPC